MCWAKWRGRLHGKEKKKSISDGTIGQLRGELETNPSDIVRCVFRCVSRCLYIDTSKVVRSGPHTASKLFALRCVMRARYVVMCTPCVWCGLIRQRRDEKQMLADRLNAAAVKVYLIRRRIRQYRWSSGCYVCTYVDGYLRVFNETHTMRASVGWAEGAPLLYK